VADVKPRSMIAEFVFAFLSHRNMDAAGFAASPCKEGKEKTAF
jgi:hypothetical protein